MGKKVCTQIDNDSKIIGYGFECPGCKSWHVLSLKPAKPGWTFSGTVENPTLSPSILQKTNDPSAKTYQKNAMSSVCHSFVENGKIRFLDDCTHELKGKTVDLPDIE